MPEVQEPVEILQPRKLEVSPEITWVQQLKNRVNKTLKREREPDSPKLSIDIFYSPHKTETDIQALEERFQSADIFFPENSGWTSWGLNYYQRLSRGEVTPEEVLRETGWS